MSIKWGYSFAGFQGMHVGIKKEHNERNFKTVAACGYDGVELLVGTGRTSPLGRPSMIDIVYGGAEEFRDYLKELKAGTVIAWDYDPGAPCGEESCKTGRDTTDPVQHQSIADALEPFAAYLQRLGGKYIPCRPMRQAWVLGTPSDEQIRNAAECWNKAGSVTARYGVKILLHIDWFCAANDETVIDKLMEYTDPELVGLCLDTAELALAGIDPLKVYENHADRVELFHFGQIFVSDTLEERKRPFAESILQNGGEREIERWFWELGAPERPGLVDHEKLMKAIRTHGYDGWIIVETRQTPDAHASAMLNSWYVNHVLKKI